MSERFSNESNRSTEVRTAAFVCQLKHRAKGDADFGTAGSVKLRLVPTNNPDQLLVSEKTDGELRELIKSVQRKEQRRRSQSGDDNLPSAA